MCGGLVVYDGRMLLCMDNQGQDQVVGGQSCTSPRGYNQVLQAQADLACFPRVIMILANLCHLCPESVDAVIRTKMIKVCSEGQWQCADCGWMTPAKMRLWEHIESNHVQSSGYVCPCGKFCRTKNAFQTHKSRFHRLVKLK